MIFIYVEYRNPFTYIDLHHLDVFWVFIYRRQTLGKTDILCALSIISVQYRKFIIVIMSMLACLTIKEHTIFPQNPDLQPIFKFYRFVFPHILTHIIVTNNRTRCIRNAIFGTELLIFIPEWLTI